MARLLMSRQPILFVTALAVLLTCAPSAEALRERGTNGADVLIGSHGRDVLDGRRGNDEILGLRGVDTLIGGAGRDTITGEGGDRISGGSGADRITIEKPSAGFRVRCGSGRDRLVIDQVDQVRPLVKRSLMRRMSGCDLITLRTGKRAPEPPPDSGGAPAPAPVSAGAAVAGHYEFDPAIKLFGITHATGGGGAGLRALRGIGVSMDRMEFRPDQSWAEIDERYTLALKEGMRVLPILNQLQRISTIDVGTFSAWVAAFSARYGPGGSFWAGRADASLAMHHIELFNEPYGAWDFSPVEPAAFARLYVAAVDAGRRANPQTRYLLPSQPTVDENGASRPWTAELFAAQPDLAARVDGLAVHPYGSWTPGANPLWTYWKTRWLNDEWTRRGAPRPIWITEVGQCTSSSAPNCVTEEQQAEAIRFYVADARATPYIKAVLVFTHRDAEGDPGNRENWFGIVRKDLTPKPAFWAYRDAIAAG
ncbi:MAG: calcium-binding protein [Solirubrobacteraceae bacterium]|nr:calcium-binding protein [Solirubrobacteraceae bacterium]